MSILAILITLMAALSIPITLMGPDRHKIIDGIDILKLIISILITFVSLFTHNVIFVINILVLIINIDYISVDFMYIDCIDRSG